MIKELLKVVYILFFIVMFFVTSYFEGPQEDAINGTHFRNFVSLYGGQQTRPY